MSLWLRSYVAVAAIVATTALLAFVATGRGVLAPLSDKVFDAYVDQALFVAEQVESGVPPEQAGRRMRLEVQLEDHPPPPPPGRGRRSRWDAPRELRRMERDGREVMYRPGPRDRVHVRTERGWVAVHRELDLDQPSSRLMWLLLGCAALVGLAGTWFVRVSLRPVHAATEAMERVAAGDLEHRLPDEGPQELRQVASAFHQMTQRIQALLRADRQLVAGVSHELRTPLSRLRLRLELLRDELGGSDRLDAMEADLVDLDHLVGELVELSRLQLGGFELHREAVSFEALVAEAARGAGLGERLVVEGSGALCVDRGLAVRVVGNLLQNAARYAPDGPVTVRLDGVRMTVRDEGPGVPPEALATLFEPFVRVDESRAKHTGGLGLGLMIVKQVAELHGGGARARLAEGGGLEVTVDWGAEAGHAA